MVIARGACSRLLLTTLACFFHVYGVRSSEMIEGMFVFGSSLVDNGNNNFLQNSVAKADYFPYGIDFPYGPSGRFTNGKNVIDLLGDRLHLPLIPAFADPLTKGFNITHGVNYASGASGILDDTGSVAGNVISLSKQIRNFEEVTLPELEAQKGINNNKGGDLLAKYLFVLGSGGNDYLFNYFLKISNANVSLQAFTSNLTDSLSTQLKKLYNLGVRKFVLMSVNPLGCSPMIINNPMLRNASRALNQAAQLFNSHLKSLVDSTKQQMPGCSTVLVNSYKIIRDIIRHPTPKGFEDATKACCEVGAQEGGDGNGVLCKKQGQHCKDRSSHVFFDGLHPTEAVNVHIATIAFNSINQAYVYPINVKQLANL